MMWKGLFLLSTVGLSLAGENSRRQSDDPACIAVTTQLNSVLRACRTGTIQCVEDPSLNFDYLSGLLCVERARTNYETFARCRGQEFADQVFATICSGPGRDREPTEGSSDPRCFELVRTNPGVEAFQACCRNPNVTGSCNNLCRTELQTLKRQLSCCTQTAPYVVYFETCGNGMTLQTLYESCGVSLPDPCNHLFTPVSTLATSAGTTPDASAAATLALVIVPLLKLLP